MLKFVHTLAFLRYGWHQDVLLQEGVALYKDSGGWDKVAEHVGEGVTDQQCTNRWLWNADNHGGEQLNQEPWTEAEV